MIFKHYNILSINIKSLEIIIKYLMAPILKILKCVFVVCTLRLKKFFTFYFLFLIKNNVYII